ncbi:TPA: HU family DNA-binding protein [Clostridioides difficile]|nr:HU family DNA-binding protein [Clostridioides difficile]HBG3257154.1 HU family DNA-binding protein [Clostridioides difficile]HBH3655548.1 HU family DNA-binding protein [Clostridioides difficile]
MKTKEFIKMVAEGLDVSQVKAREILDVIEEKRNEVLKNGDELTLMGVKYLTKVQKGREGEITLEDGTKKPWKTEDKRVPKVKAAKSLKDAII